MVYTVAEIVWLRWLVSDMSISLTRLTPMFCDNQSVILITHNSVFDDHTIHIEIDCHFTRHHLLHSFAMLPFVSSSIQLANLFTKWQTTKHFHFLCNKLSMFLGNAS